MMVGGAGNDDYIVDDVEDVIVEAGGPQAVPATAS